MPFACGLVGRNPSLLLMVAANASAANSARVAIAVERELQRGGAYSREYDRVNAVGPAALRAAAVNTTIVSK